MIAAPVSKGDPSTGRALPTGVGGGGLSATLSVLSNDVFSPSLQ